VTSQAARWLADRENAADLIGGVSLSDKDNTLASVLLDLSQSATMKASDDAAERVHQALRDIGRTHKSHPESANFVVLRSPDVPSILVETAFISNPLEERKLRDPKHQQALATAVMGGVKDYFESTPPPGTWFAAQAAAADGGRIARAMSPADGKAAVHAAVTTAPERHRVGRGESLGSIARQYGVSVGTLRSANQLRGDVLRAGTVLTIPAS